MPNIGLSTGLNDELGAKYKTDNPDFLGNNNAAAKAWFRDAAEAFLVSGRVNAVDNSDWLVAGAAADAAIAAREQAWDDLDAEKDAAKDNLKSELGTGVS